MAAIAAPTKVGLVFPDAASMVNAGTIVRQRKLAAAVAVGQAVYLNSAGKADVADAATSAATAQFRGIALSAGNAGDTISVVEQGEIFGFNLGSVAYDGFVYLDTAGALATTANGTKTVVVGRCSCLTDSPTLTKVLRVNVNYNSNW
jgi:hypothetical protein